MHGGSHTERHAAGGTSVHQMPVAGRMVISGLIFLTGLFAARAFGLSQGFGIGLAILFWLGLETCLYAIRRMWRSRQRKRATENYALLHELKEQEAKLRIAEAKSSGAFDRWK